MIVLQTKHGQESLPSGYEVKLGDYKTAIRNGVAFYITAEIEASSLEDTAVFLVGDEQVYGGYQNVKLEDTSYNVYQRSFTSEVRFNFILQSNGINLQYLEAQVVFYFIIY